MAVLGVIKRNKLSLEKAYTKKLETRIQTLAKEQICAATAFVTDNVGAGPVSSDIENALLTLREHNAEQEKIVEEQEKIVKKGKKEKPEKIKKAQEIIREKQDIIAQVELLIQEAQDTIVQLAVREAQSAQTAFDTEICIPRVFRDYCSEAVLTMEVVPALSISEYVAAAPRDEEGKLDDPHGHYVALKTRLAESNGAPDVLSYVIQCFVSLFKVNIARMYTQGIVYPEFRTGMFSGQLNYPRIALVVRTHRHNTGQTRLLRPFQNA